MNYVNKNVEKDISFASDHLVDFTGDPPLAHSESGTLRYETLRKPVRFLSNKSICKSRAYGKGRKRHRKCPCETTSRSIIQ